MVGAKEPKYIEKLENIYWPYRHELFNNKLENVPQEAIDAYETCKKWAWEQDQ